MAHSRKIATCCYCGRRSELVLGGRVQHELSCGSCGAPLHNMKRLPAEPGPVERPYMREPLPQARPAAYQPRRPQKRRKPWGRRLLSGLIDVVEDVVDEVFD